MNKREAYIQALLAAGEILDNTVLEDDRLSDADLKRVNDAIQRIGRQLWQRGEKLQKQAPTGREDG